MDWESFQEMLKAQLGDLDPLKPITNQEQLNTACEKLTVAIQMTIEAEVSKTTIYSKSK